MRAFSTDKYLQFANPSCGNKRNKSNFSPVYDCSWPPFAFFCLRRLDTGRIQGTHYLDAVSELICTWPNRNWQLTYAARLPNKTKSVKWSSQQIYEEARTDINRRAVAHTGVMPRANGFHWATDLKTPDDTERKRAISINPAN